MSLLAVSLLLAALSEDSPPGQERPSVVIVSDGGSGEVGQRAHRVVEALRASMSACRKTQLALFDSEPGRGDTGNRRAVKARTPMREAMEAAFAYLAEAPGPRTMVVIAHEQFYPSGVPSRRLIDLARRTHTTVHTIFLTGKPNAEGFGARLNRTTRNHLVWFVETFVADERGYSDRDTARLLKTMAGATGGTACAVDADEPSPECIGRVAAAVASGAR